MTETNNILGAVWTTTYVDSLPDSSFAFVDGKTRKLPYKDANGKVDLPHVRNALARLSQTQGIPDDEKARIKTKLQSALKNAKGADDLVLRTVHAIQASDSSTLPSKVMLLRSGIFNTSKYGEVPVSADSINEYKANFDNGIGMADQGQTGIPVDYAHKSHLNAAFWIKGLEVTPDPENSDEKILWGTNLEFSDSGRQAILGKEYKCLSSDFYPEAYGEWVDPESGMTAKNVIVGAALTNRPMFTGNQPINASEIDTNTDESGGIQTVIYINATEKKEGESMNIDELRVKQPTELTGAEYQFLAQNVDKLVAEELDKFSLKATVAETKETPKVVEASEVKGNEGLVAIQAADLKILNDKVNSLQSSYQAKDREDIKNQVLAFVKVGKIKADQTDFWTDEIIGKDAEGRKKVLAGLEALAANPVLAKEQGSGDADENVGTDPRTELMNKAIKKMQASQSTKNPMTITEAVEAIKAEEPELADRAIGQRKEQLSRIEATDDQFAAAGINRG